MSSVLVYGSPSDDLSSSAAEDTREVFSTISPSNPLDMDPTTSAPSTPITEPAPSAPSPPNLIEERLSRLRPTLHSRLKDDRFDPWNQPPPTAQPQPPATSLVQSHSIAPSKLLPATSPALSNGGPSILRIGFDSHGAGRSPSTTTLSSSSSSSSSPSSLQPAVHPLAYQPKPSLLSAQSSSSSARRGSADDGGHHAHHSAPVTSSVINGVALSNAVPTARSMSPLPTHSASASSTNSHLSSSIPRSNSSSSLSTAASPSTPSLFAPSSRTAAAALPAFLKGGVGVSSVKGGDKTGKRKKVAVSDDEEEEQRQQEREELEERREEEKRQQKRTKPGTSTSSSASSSSARRPSAASAAPSAKSANRLTQLRQKATREAKVRNIRGGGGGGASATSGRAVKEEEAEDEDNSNDHRPGVHIVVSPSLNGIDPDDDDAPPPPDSPSPFSLSPRKQPLPSSKRAQALASSPRLPLSPVRSSTPDPIKRVKGSAGGRLSPMPPSPSHTGGSPSPSATALLASGTCARLRPWLGSSKERVGGPMREGPVEGQLGRHCG